MANAVEEFNTTISEFTKEPQLDACFQLYNKAQVWETKMSGEGGRRVQLLSVLQTEFIGFKILKDGYIDDNDFSES